MARRHCYVTYVVIRGFVTYRCASPRLVGTCAIYMNSNCVNYNILRVVLFPRLQYTTLNSAVSVCIFVVFCWPQWFND